jgi:hypothetical protein
LKVIDKIDVDSFSDKKAKKTTKVEVSNADKDAIEELPKTTKKTKTKAEKIESEIIKTAQPAIDEVEDKASEDSDESVEHITTKFQKIEGLKQLGKVDLNVIIEKKEKPKKEKKEEPKRPIVEKVKTTEDLDAKKKRSRINETSPEKQRVIIGSEPDKAKFFFDKKKKKDKFEKETIEDGPKRPEKPAQVSRFLKIYVRNCAKRNETIMLKKLSN